MKILKNNIFIFFVLGVIFSIISFEKTGWESIFLQSALFCFIPFFVAIIMNLLINITEKEIEKEQTKTLTGIKKTLEGIMRITNILSIIFFLGCLGFIIIN